MQPSYLLERLDEMRIRLDRGEEYLAIRILEQLQDQVKQEALDLDAWSEKEERRNYVGN